MPQLKIRMLVLHLFCLVGAVQAQYDIPMNGLVVEQNSKYLNGKVAYIPGAWVYARSQVAQTDNLGRFNFVFSDQHPGISIRLNASKAGYVVVNQEEIDQASVLGRLSPVKIVMCPYQQLAENKARYYNIALEAVEETYAQQVQILEQKGSAHDALIRKIQTETETQSNDLAVLREKLAQQREVARQNAVALSGQFAVANLDDADSLYVAAYEAFMRKQIDSVFIILDYERLKNTIDRDLEQISVLEKRLQAEKLIDVQYQDTLKKLIRAYDLKAQVLIARGDTAAALMQYNLVCPLDESWVSGAHALELYGAYSRACPYFTQMWLQTIQHYTDISLHSSAFRTERYKKTISASLLKLRQSGCTLTTAEIDHLNAIETALNKH